MLRAPLHFVNLSSKLVSGKFKIGVHLQLPIADVDLILGNDLASERLFPPSEVLENPIATSSTPDPAASESIHLFPVCAVTRAHARKYNDLVDLNDSFLNKSDSSNSLNVC